jgi:hypothetical protein
MSKGKAKAQMEAKEREGFLGKRRHHPGAKAQPQQQGHQRQAQEDGRPQKKRRHRRRNYGRPGGGRPQGKHA